jgi:gamma-glutamyl-gamma-aminobutyrate hydrolase PuuD
MSRKVDQHKAMNPLQCLIVLFAVASGENVSGTTCQTTESPGKPRLLLVKLVQVILPVSVIGILTQDYLGDFRSYKLNRTFIPATYVKFIESSGGRVIPVHTDQSQQYYEQVLDQINGLLLPGGDQDTVNSSFTRASRIIYRRAIELNQRGVYFPIWGVCQGFEVLSYLAADQNLLQSCSANDYATPIRFTMDLKSLQTKSKLFQKMSLDEFDEVANNEVVFQWHNLCLQKDSYLQSQLLQTAFQVLGTNHDMDGNEYVSIMESHKYPIYGIMFHPEEVMFSFRVKENHTSVPHSKHALHASQYFANFFMNECRKNPNHMDEEALQRQIIYNFAPEHTTDSREPYDLCYFFPIRNRSPTFGRHTKPVV